MQETIALVFDFDDTLAPDSTSGFLEQAGIKNIREFWDKEVHSLMEADWDPIPAYLYMMLERSGTNGVPAFTRDALIAWGRCLPLYKGVDTLFDRLCRVVADINPRLRLEYYIISSGIGDVIRHTPIARHFEMIWASEFHYDEQGRIKFPKKINSFTDKTRYLFHIQKGLCKQSIGKPFLVNKKYKDEQLRIPFKNMIVVGDGYTDIPCFSLVRTWGGKAIAVYDRKDEARVGRAWGFIVEGRVDTWHSADYREGTDLSTTLTSAVKELAENLSHMP